VAAGLSGTVKSRWERTILVCAKCSKKIDGGFGPKGKQSLAKALRRYLGLKLWRKAWVGIVEVKCLGVCPRGAVTVVDAAEPGRWRLVPKGTDVGLVAQALELDGRGEQAS
jgi:predicted metal-binding protein